MSDWYAAWTEEYSRMFGIRDPLDVRTLLSWRFVFSATRTSEAEMKAAALWLASNVGVLGEVRERFGGKMTMHLSAIQRALREVRALDKDRIEARQREQESRLGTCTICGSSGMVTVPNPKHVENGEWRPVRIARGGSGPSYYTCAVLCSCALGRWKADRQSHERRQMTLDQYHAINPAWRQQMDERAEERRAEANASPAPAEWQRCIQGVIDRFFERQKTRKAEVP